MSALDRARRYRAPTAILVALIFLGACLGVMGLMAPAPQVANWFPPLTFELAEEKTDVVTDTSKRRAVFLIDCSNSMSTSVGTQAKTRWTVARNRIGDLLRDLQSKSPCIEVELRFFGYKKSELPKPATQRLCKQQDVDVLLSAVPETPPSAGGTPLSESLYEHLGEALRTKPKSGYDWFYFCLVTDADTDDTKSEKGKFEKVLRQASAEIGGFTAVTATVGDDQKIADFAKRYGFGEAEDISKVLPKPPPPRIRFRLQLDPVGQTLVSSKLARDGDQVPLELVLAKGQNLVAGLELTAAFQGKPLEVQSQGNGRWSAQLKLDVSVASGVSGTLQITPLIKGIPIERVIAIPVVFPASKTLPPDKWTWEMPPHLRVDTPGSFAATVGQFKTAVWVFTSPSGKDERVEEIAVARPFAEAGTWKVGIEIVADNGDKVKRSLGTVEVVDASFQLVPPQEPIRAGDPSAQVAIQSIGKSKVGQWTAEVNGKPAEFTPGNGAVIVPAVAIKEPGSCVLNVKSNSDIGNYEWSQTEVLDVQVRPLISSLVDTVSFVEGERTVAVPIRVTGDVGDKLQVLVDGKKVQTVDTGYPPDGPKLLAKTLVVDIPAGCSQNLKVELLPSIQGACPTTTVKLVMREADLKVVKVKPEDGKLVKADGSATLSVELRGDDIKVVDGVAVEIAFDSSPTGQSSPLRAEMRGQPPSGAVGIPANLPPAKHEVFARIIGGRLRGDIFPRKFELIGFVEIAKPDLRVVCDSTKPALGQPLVFKTTGVKEEEASGWTWTVEGAELDPNDAKKPTISLTPDKWGPIKARVEVTVRGGVKVSSELTVETTGESPGVNPTTDTDRPRRGQESVQLQPGLTGSSKGWRYRLWRTDAEGNRADSPEREEEFDTSRTSVPVSLVPKDGKPDLNHYEIEVEVIPFSGDPKPLLPALLRGRVLPQPQWVWWAIAVALLLWVTYRIWKWLSGNEPIRWELQFSASDPGPATGDFAMSSLRIGPPRRHPSGNSPAYSGWNRREKEALIPLWCLRDRSDSGDLDWIADGGAENLKLVVRNYWQRPFYRSPGPEDGWSEAEGVHAPLDGDVRFSETKRLVAATGADGRPRSIYVRMRCPRGRDPLFWIFWVWSIVVLITGAALLPVFNIILLR